MTIVFTAPGALISLYAALMTGAPVYIWVSVVLLVALAAAWIMLYCRASGS